MKKILFLLLCSLTVYSCVSRPRYYSKPLHNTNINFNGYTERGIASWYGPKFHGRRTSDGEIYNMYSMTAAHKILPFNTRVLVINLYNHKRVIVRINDRGPFVKDRIIDLSYAAAKALDMIRTGTAPVIIKVINTHPTNDTYYIQVGSFKDEKNALKIYFFLKRKGFQGSRVLKVTSNRGIYYRVQAGEFLDIRRARYVLSHLVKEFPNAFIVAR